MFSEYDVVRARLNRFDATVPLGTIGTVLIVYDSDPPAYEIEFMDEAGRSFGTFTVDHGDLEPVPSPGARP